MKASIGQRTRRAGWTSLIILGLALPFGCGDDSDGEDAGVDTGLPECTGSVADCDGNGSCETDLTSDATCGSCTNVCGAGLTCSASELMCVPRDFDAGMEMGCGVTWPLRVEGPSDPELTATFGLRDVRVDQREGRWRDIGWSLDRRCTIGPSDEHACVPPAAAAPPVDGADGRDNVFGATVLEQLANSDGLFETTIQDRMFAGEALVLHVADWNGTDNDSLVTVFLAQAAGVRGSDAPSWDGSDIWNVSADNFITVNDLPRIGDDNAYVADRVLVTRFPDREPVTIPFADAGSFTFRLTELTLVGRISDDGQRLEDVLLAGRFALIDIERALEEAGICPGTAVANAIESLFAINLDLRSIPGTGSPGAICDALSVAIPLTGYRGALGDIVPSVVPSPAVCE